MFFENSVLEMIEKGQVDRFKESLKKSRKVCESNLLQGNPLGLFKIGTLFLILGFGITLSLIFSISEKFHYFYKPEKQTNSVVLRSLLKLEKQIMDSLPYLEDSFKGDIELFRKKIKEKMYKLET